MRAIIYEAAEYNEEGCIRIVQGVKRVEVNEEKGQVHITGTSDSDSTWIEKDTLVKIELLP